MNENHIAFNIKKLILGDTIQFSLSFSYWIEKLKNLTQVPPSPQNILHVIRFKTPLISKYLSKTFQVNEQSPKYSIILQEKQLVEWHFQKRRLVFDFNAQLIFFTINSQRSILSSKPGRKKIVWCVFCKILSTFTDFPKLAEKLSVIRTDRHENLVRPKNILPVRKKSPKKFTVTCIMFSLAFLEWFTLVLAIGHLISPLIFIEVKVIQFSVLFKIVYVMSFIVCLEFCCFETLYYRSMVVWKTSCHWLIYIRITNRVVIVFTNGFGWNRKCIKGMKTMKIM